MYVCFLNMPLEHTEVFSGDAFWIKTSLASVVFILLCWLKRTGSELFCQKVGRVGRAGRPGNSLMRFS
jgi:hypothetical protein